MDPYVFSPPSRSFDLTRWWWEKVRGIAADMEQNVQAWEFEKFPIDLKAYKPLPLDPVKDKKLSQEQRKQLVSVCSLIASLRPCAIGISGGGAETAVHSPLWG